jgi:chromosome segregation ATPase
MLIDSNAPLCHCDATIPPFEDDLDEAALNDDDVEDEDEGFSLVSHAATEQTEDALIDDDIVADHLNSILNDSMVSSQNSVASDTVVDVNLQDVMPNDLVVHQDEPKLSICTSEQNQFVDSGISTETDPPSRNTVVETKAVSWTKRELLLLSCVVASLLVAGISLTVTLRTIQESGQYKLQVKMQNVVTATLVREQETELSKLYDEIEKLHDQAGSLEESHQTEMRRMKEKVNDLQESFEFAKNQEEVIQQLQGQVYLMQSEAAEMQMASEKEDRRVKRRLRDLQVHLDKMQERAQIYERYYTVSSGQIDDWRKKYEQAMDTSEKCQKRVHRLKKETKQAVAEAKHATNELRKVSKELAQSMGTVSSQKETIQSLRKKLSVEAERRRKRASEAKANASFPWEGADDSVLIDNCWLYLKAKMDVGECVWDMKDNVKDHFESFGRSFSEAFQNFRKEFKQFHSSEKSLYRSHKKLWKAFEQNMEQ